MNDSTDSFICLVGIFIALRDFKLMLVGRISNLTLVHMLHVSSQGCYHCSIGKHLNLVFVDGFFNLCQQHPGQVDGILFRILYIRNMSELET